MNDGKRENTYEVLYSTYNISVKHFCAALISRHFP